MLSTLPAVILLDSVGRRPLLMWGAAGCCISLLLVGSLVAAFGDDWPGHVTAGHAAIGTSRFSILVTRDTTTDAGDPAFIFLYDVNFSYSWAPIGWGM